MAEQGYKFYTIAFYLMVAMLAVAVAVCVWVAWCFKNDSFPFLWPIKFVRVVVSFFFGMFYIAALNVYLVMLECMPVKGVWEHHAWHVREYACRTWRAACGMVVASPGPRGGSGGEGRVVICGGPLGPAIRLRSMAACQRCCCSMAGLRA